MPQSQMELNSERLELLEKFKQAVPDFMAAEAAVLGTPAVYVNPLSLGYTAELEEEYGLLFEYTGDERHARGLEQAVSVIEEPAETWERRRERLLADRIDVTELVVRQVETLAQARTSGRATPVPNPDHP